jgi:arginine decarboxylase
MRIKYLDLIEQTFHWPQEEFQLDDDNLEFHGLPLKEIAEKYGTPLKFSYLPKIGANILKTKEWFKKAMSQLDYTGSFHYCYVTKSSHFKWVLEECLKAGSHIETSSAFDIDLINALWQEGKLSEETRIICNGFKQDNYVDRIATLVENGFTRVIPIIDNESEVMKIRERMDQIIDVGIRIASEEEPKFEFYTSRLGIGYRDIIRFYKTHIEEHPHLNLKMLHFFVNTGINDNAYYWNELNKCLKVYCQLKKICPSLDSLNIGGGFPIKNSLAFDYDYYYMIHSILEQIKNACEAENIPVPHIYTEFGSFTVGESGGMLYEVIYQKKQNDKESWNMINSSFMTTLPDSWAINKRFLMLPVNNWKDEYERVFLGGLTCDSDDYYNSEQHVNAIYLPKFNANRKQYIGFFNTGAYQDSLGGYGGVHHCLIPGPRHILIDKDKTGKFVYTEFSKEQQPEDIMKLLGFARGDNATP